MRVGRQRKDPDSISIHTIDWSKWLAKRGSDTIVAAVWSLGALAAGAVPTNDDTTTSITIGKLGTIGSVHEIEVHITTATGLEDDGVMLIAITEV